MTLNKPNAVDEPQEPDTVESDTTPSEATQEQENSSTEDSTVSLYGAEMDLESAVRLISDVIDTPDEYGLVSSERVEPLETNTEDHRERINQLEGSIAELYAAITAMADTDTDWRHADVTVYDDGEYEVSLDPTGNGEETLSSE
ncbi:hypothetical protein ABNG03_07925 [Halorubrum sp. RMP-47]|uniref:Halobacterial output domain-containing protein n=1 Tax=Halorubrum miltondacostae TaxID=3076378 RepID=A0ABD5M1B5_9EURY